MDAWTVEPERPVATTEQLQDRIAELEAIIDTLPKCNRLNEAGELVCDKPVTPGMVVFVIDSEWSDDGEPIELTVKGMEGPGLLVDNTYGEREPIDPAICYDTREAAEAAKGK